jgi:hypothetical protein
MNDSQAPDQPQPAGETGNKAVHDGIAHVHGQNKPAPDTPSDGAQNQGGIRRMGLEYQKELGQEQDQ